MHTLCYESKSWTFSPLGNSWLFINVFTLSVPEEHEVVTRYTFFTSKYWAHPHVLELLLTLIQQFEFISFIDYMKYGTRLSWRENFINILVDIRKKEWLKDVNDMLLDVQESRRVELESSTCSTYLLRLKRCDMSNWIEFNFMYWTSLRNLLF